MLMTYEQSEWEIYVAGRTLSNDSTVPSVMDHNPFQGRDPPRWVRGEHVRRGSNVAHGKWWQRRRIRPHLKIDSFSSSENNQTDTVQPLRLYVMLFCVLCAKLFSVISFLSIVTVA